MSSIEIVESMHGLQTERGLKHHRGPCCGLQDASPPKPKTIAAVRQAAESIWEVVLLSKHPWWLMMN